MPISLLSIACLACAIFFLLRMAALWGLDAGLTCHADGTTMLWEYIDVVLGSTFAVLVLRVMLQTMHGEALRREAAQALIAGERWRIAQDLHDGASAHLVHALATLDASNPQQHRLRHVLEQALLELRDTVDSVEADSDPLVQRLARLRYRIQPSLDRQGIRMLWTMASLPPDAIDNGRASQLIRIVQEALCNVVQHAGASMVDVALIRQRGSNRVLLEIRDDGRGMDPRMLGAGRPGGRGLAGMRRRARLAGAELQIQSHPGGGMYIRMVIPLQGR